MRKGDNKQEGMAMPTSVALANRQMSLSMTEVNHVSWGKEYKNERKGREETSKTETEIAVWSSEVQGWT